MAMPTGEHCWKKNSGAPWARTSNLWIPSLTRSPLRYLGKYVKWDLNSYCIQRYSITTMLHVTAEPRGRPVASSMYFYQNRKYCRSWNWENYMFTYTTTRSIIFLYKIIMHAWRMTQKIDQNLSKWIILYIYRLLAFIKKIGTLAKGKIEKVPRDIRRA